MGLTSVALAAVAVVEAATGLACVSFPQRLGADAAAASLSLLGQIGALRIAYAAMLGIAVFSLSASLSLLATAVLVHECLLTQVALSKQPMFKGKVWLSLLLGFVRSALNPADDGTRHRRLRRARAPCRRGHAAVGAPARILLR